VNPNGDAPATTRRASFFISSFIFYFEDEKNSTLACPREKYRFHPCLLWGERGREGETTHTACPLSRCHPAGRSLTFRPCDRARPRVDAPPCNMNSHLESSCGYEHETLKETAAMDPVPSHHLAHCLLKRPPHCSLKEEEEKHT